MFTIHTKQEPADSDRPKLGGAIKRLENSVLIAYASEGRGLVGSAGNSCLHNSAACPTVLNSPDSRTRASISARIRDASNSDAVHCTTE
jgi:hypothetical protein